MALNEVVAHAPASENTTGTGAPRALRITQIVVASILGALLVPVSWVMSFPGANGFVGLAVLGCAFVATVALMIVASVMGGVRYVRYGGFPLVFTVAFAMAVASLGTVLTAWPLDARFRLSQSDFEAIASEPPEWDYRAQQVGSFEITSIESEGKAVVFTERNGAGIMGGAGFAYLPNGPTTMPLSVNGMGQVELHSLNGDWYSWTASG